MRKVVLTEKQRKFWREVGIIVVGVLLALSQSLELFRGYGGRLQQR